MEISKSLAKSYTYNGKMLPVNIQKDKMLINEYNSKACRYQFMCGAREPIEILNLFDL